MSLESATASLHAGLIERARPRTAPSEAPSGPPTFVDLLAERAVRICSMVRQPQPAAETQVAPLRPGPRGRPFVRIYGPRFGLTVRVEPELRDRLDLLCERTGRTKQSILHEALMLRLAAEPRRPPRH